MSPISDIGAFRNGRWTLEQFLKSIRLNLEWAADTELFLIPGPSQRFFTHGSAVRP